jgi:hypothetical protein
MQADAVTNEPIQENLLRKGAALAYGSKSKGHGDKAVQHLKNSNQKLGSISRKDLSSEQKLDLLADALVLQNQALAQLRMQLGSAVSVNVATALLVQKDKRR